MTTPTATNGGMNQCDGCQAGFALDGDFHRWPDGMPYMICTKELYQRAEHGASLADGKGPGFDSLDLEAANRKADKAHQ